MLVGRCMALLTALTLEAAREFGAEYGLDVEQVEALTLGSVNSNFRFVTRDGSRYFARVYEEQGQSGAEFEVRLLTTLADRGVPVVPPLVNRSGARVREVAGKPFAVFPWIEGEWLCLERVTPRHCHALGAALARVHVTSPALSGLPRGRFRPSDMHERLARVESEGARHLGADLERIRSLYARYLPQRDPALPNGICHGDLFRDNVLWRGTDLKALLDFESAALGSFAYDLMVTTLAWCYRDALVVENARALFQGYATVRALTAEERAALAVEGIIGCLRFATTRITDFELRAPSGQPPARDFRRFLLRVAAIEAGAFEPVWAP
jgi:homoserine kinase type II